MNRRKQSMYVQVCNRNRLEGIIDLKCLLILKEFLLSSQVGW